MALITISEEFHGWSLADMNDWATTHGFGAEEVWVGYAGCATHRVKIEGEREDGTIKIE